MSQSDERKSYLLTRSCVLPTWWECSLISSFNDVAATLKIFLPFVPALFFRFQGLIANSEIEHSLLVVLFFHVLMYLIFLPQIVELCLQYICYDPNYNYEDDDDEEDAMDTEGEEEG